MLLLKTQKSLLTNGVCVIVKKDNQNAFLFMLPQNNAMSLQFYHSLSLDTFLPHDYHKVQFYFN